MPCAACGNKQSSSNSTQRNSTLFLRRRRNSQKSFQRVTPFLQTNVPKVRSKKIKSRSKNNVMILGTLK